MQEVHMDQRKALAMAAGVTATAVAAVIAIGVNFGLFGVAAAGGRTGKLTPAATRIETVDTVPPVEPAPVVETVVIDAPTSGPATLAPGPTPAGEDPVVTVVDDGSTPAEVSGADAQHPEDSDHPDEPAHAEDEDHELDD
jgi:hypothetical protein